MIAARLETGNSFRGCVTPAAAALIMSALLVFPPAAYSQDYPNGQIRLLSSTFPGGIIDVLARIYAQKLQERSGQTVVVENTTVAVGTIGVAQLAKAPPDGYSLLVAHAANMSIQPILNPKLPYEPRKAFAPVALLGRADNLLLVPKASPIHSVKALIDEAKARPGTLTYASPGLGSTGHLATEQFKLAAGIDLVHVPYRGAAPAITALVAGQISMMIDTVPGNIAQVQAGNLRALAVASERRAAVLPDVPTIAEAGVPGVQGGLWVGLFVPAGAAAPIVTYLNRQAQEIFALPDVRAQLDPLGVILPRGSPAEFAAFLDAEEKRWRDVITKAKIVFPN